MRAGELRHRVTIHAALSIDDGHHGFDESDVVIAARIAAFVEPLEGRELERAQQIDARISHRVKIRFRRGVKSLQTVVYHDPDGDRQFEIIGGPIDVNERRRELRLMCREKAA